MPLQSRNTPRKDAPPQPVAHNPPRTPREWLTPRFKEQFVASTYRHPMRTTVKLGAKRDGTVTALRGRIVADLGAYQQAIDSGQGQSCHGSSRWVRR